MKIAVPKETFKGETRVALVPADVALLKRKEHEILVESGAGAESFIADENYVKAGATLATRDELYASADIVFKVRPPSMESPNEADLLREGQALVCHLAPYANQALIALLAKRGVTAFAMEYVPRISRAQSMDALSSMATLSGYRAVLLAAGHLRKIFPLMMTAAGSIPPAAVLILGAGVAGLQAIATAKRLGAKVEAFDPRPVVKEQVESLGAQFVEMEVQAEDVETKGGYAKEQSDAFLEAERKTISEHLAKTDVVITTAAIFGKTAPVLITAEMLGAMRPGSVIIDLVAEMGGNCSETKPGEVTESKGVIIDGTLNLPGTLQIDASKMYSKNVTNLFNQLVAGEGEALDFEDEITSGACLTRGGQIVNEQVKTLVENEGSAT